MSAGKFRMNREDHPDVQIRDVIAQSPNGEWLRFDTLLEAKTILMPQHQERIFRSYEDFEKRLSQGAKSQLMERFQTQSTRLLWEALQKHAKNPLRKHAQLLASEINPSGRRVRRPRVLKYEFNLDARSQKNVDAFYRLPPQAQALVEIIEEYVNKFTVKTVLETELKTYIMEHREKLNTQQDPWRIFQYYRGKLIASGFLRFAR